MKSMDAEVDAGGGAVEVQVLTEIECEEEVAAVASEAERQPAGEEEPVDDAPDAEAADADPTDDPPLPEGLTARLEAVLLTLDRPATSAKLADWLDVGLEEGGSGVIGRAVAALNEEYEQAGRSFRIERVAGGWQIRTLGDFAADLAKVRQRRSEGKLSQAALETLAIVAYRQPILRADIEAIRGVACGEVLRTLMERRLVKIVGRAEELGRPMLYGTTSKFLEAFGLSSLKDLPKEGGTGELGN
jgi:segregation and condensation protein B